MNSLRFWHFQYLMIGSLFGFRTWEGLSDNRFLNFGPFCQIGLCSVAVEVREEGTIEVNSTKLWIHRKPFIGCKFRGRVGIVKDK